MQERFEMFTVLINRISRDIRRIKNQEMAAYHLRSAHVSCLYYIYSMGGVTSAELCEHCEEDKATISRALDYLEANGFILRPCKGAKRYKSPLQLTEKGREAGKRIDRRDPGGSWILSAILSRKMRGRHFTVAFQLSAEVWIPSPKAEKNKEHDEIEDQDYH